MILIKKGETKRFYFYLEGNPQYANFYLKSNDTDRVTIIGSTNGSTSAAYDWFTFSEGSGLTAAGGFTLDEGTYNVEIWSTNNSLLERSLMQVIGTGSTFIWQNPTASTDYVYYNPDGLPPPGLTGN